MKTVTVQIQLNKNVQDVWEFYTNTNHIIKWNFASPEWHCPKAEHHFEPGGKLKYHMAAKDGSMGFDYSATFKKIIPNELIEYVLDDGRRVSIRFKQIDQSTELIQTFEVEDQNPIEMQRQGWQSILNNFKNHIENN